jgi:hypothetical protein
MAEPPVQTFTYSTMAFFTLQNTIANGGFYGIADSFGSINNVSGTATLADSSTTNVYWEEIDGFRGDALTQFASSSSTPYTGGSTLNPYPTVYTIDTAYTATVNFSATSSTDKFYIYTYGDMDLRGITFTKDSIVLESNIYFLSLGTIYLAGLNYGNFIGNSVLTNGSDAVVYGSINGINNVGTAPGVAGGGDGTTLTVNFATPTYLFSYVAISKENISYVNLVGGFYGAPNIKDTHVTGSILKDSTDYLPELANITDFYNEVTTFLANPIFTINTIEDGNTSYDILPISANTWNTISLTDNTVATFNFIGTADDIFYIYNPSTPMYLSSVTFILNSANIYNIYFLGSTIYLSSSTMYGNFIVTYLLSKYPQDTPATLYGTTSAIITNGARIVQPISVDDKYITIIFTTECFMKGTKILTDHWYVPIEELKVGDMVMNYGEIQDNKFHKVESPVPQRIVKVRKTVQKASRSSSPVVFFKNTFAPNKPFENLYVSPKHGMVDRKGRLYPAKRFINDTTIYQDPTIEVITYYHIELATHCAIMANGVLTETWRDSKKKILDIKYDNDDV